ncbi:uncharacterized protein LOC105398107 isoform X1 [Plutella xylostella]|uniref:uncharacterized protein LOC105398107 isoform X1 n=2 Tax=Plutella xylostella TaxID=51655 RepID=UPI002032A473|nr:uncharacterized protein LOC105398107 isoform X1 [Plutella xylostella]
MTKCSLQQRATMNTFTNHCSPTEESNIPKEGLICITHLQVKNWIVRCLKMQKVILFVFYLASITSANISPIRDFTIKLNSYKYDDSLPMNSPHKVIQHLDNTIQKATKNVTQNPEMDETLLKMSKDLVSAILSKLEIQDKITRMTKEGLDASGKNKGITAIETRRILDYISKTLSGHILSITRSSTEPELHRLVYGLAQIAAEVSIIAALKDSTYSTALTKKQSGDLYLRKKRSTELKETVNVASHTPITTPAVYDVILNHTNPKVSKVKTKTTKSKKAPQTIPVPSGPYSVVYKSSPLHVISTNPQPTPILKGFLNQTVLDNEANKGKVNESDVMYVENKFNGSNTFVTEFDTAENAEISDDWLNSKSSPYKSPSSSDIVAEMELDQPEFEEENNEKKNKQRLDKLESKAKKAILYAGDIAYLTASSVVAMRRALTASFEVQMSVNYAKNGLSNHQELMMNLARTAAQQAGKEARMAASKSVACERVIKLALKHTAQSFGAPLNNVANRIVMDTISLGTLARTMAYVSSEIAINSLYQATDVKPPVE